jgi:hypothetical protein
VAGLILLRLDFFDLGYGGFGQSDRKLGFHALNYGRLLAGLKS